MERLEQNLKYTFKNKELLKNALAHSSYTNEKKGGLTSNERLEFLGDSVLSIIVSEYIYKNFPNLPVFLPLFCRELQKEEKVQDKQYLQKQSKIQIGHYLVKKLQKKLWDT